MRDICIAGAAVFSAAGITFGVLSILADRGDNWRHGFLTGCLAMSLTALLGAVAASWAM